MAVRFDDEISMLKFVVEDGNGVKGLVDLGLTEVPNRFIQQPHERIDKQQTCASPKNLTVDLSELDGPNHDQVVKAIAHAAETVGFFQVVNHGVPLEILESLNDSAHQFFGQPAEKKAAYLKEKSPSPLVMYGPSFNPDKEKALMWRDFITMIYTNDVDALEVWPSECKEVTLEYLKKSAEMVKRLLGILIENLGVKMEDSRLDTLTGFKMVTMTLYPTCPDPDLTIGTRRHSDYGMLTVLLQDDTGGLYVKKTENTSPGEEEWFVVPPIHGALVINVGDTLQMLSNGRYTSAEHIVRNTSTTSRVSVPLFITPLPEAKIGPLPEVVARDGVARYRELIYQDYLNNTFVKPLGGKRALDFASI